MKENLIETYLEPSKVKQIADFLSYYTDEN